MARVCTNCGTEAADSDRFCSNCGTPLGAGEGAERKLATMVFVDLVGSTAMSAGVDPEELRGKLEPFFEVARSSLRDHGGTIEKYMGDAVLAVFGVPQAHGDDPDRAVAAALDLGDRVGALGQDLAVRIGIESGEVLAQDGGGDLSVTGEPVNAAARLQQAAEPGEVLVGERAARNCRLARLEPSEAVDAKGMPAALRSWRAVESAASDADEPVAPLIGRDDDLDLLRLIYRRSVRERVPELVILTGEAGIGKTRLASELLNQVRAEAEPPRVLLGRNPPYGRGIAFWALAEILREAAGAGPDASVAEVEASLAELLEELGGNDGREVAATLSAALGGEDGRPVVAEDELRHAWRRFVALLAEDRPLLIAIDDAHWADDGLLDLLEEAAFRVQAAPLLLLCTSRPELTERRPDFGRATRNVTQIELRPLQPEAATQLVELLVPEEVRELAPRAAEASGGNPFFAEEVARRIVEEPDGALVDQLPDTVQAAIATRIDLLPADEKCALQYASVLGHTFGDAGLTDLLGKPSDEALKGLERRALVQERIGTGPGHFSFRHQLIRDVAYSSLPRTERAGLHERAAEGVRARAGERHAELTELIAFHLAQAAELEPTKARTEAALEESLEAAQTAARRGAVARSQELYESAAEMAPTDEQKIKPLRTAAELALRRWRGDQAIELFQREAEAAEDAGQGRAAAAALTKAVEVGTRMAGVTGEIPEQKLREMLDRAREVGPPDDELIRGWMLVDEAWIAWWKHHDEEIEGPAQEALRIARECGDAPLLSSALDAVTSSDWYAGRHRDALGHTQERLQLIERLPVTPISDVERSDALHMVVECMLQTGDFAEAAEYASRAREFDLSRGVVYGAWQRGILPAFFLGRWDEALEMATRVREAWVAADRPPIAAFMGSMGSVGVIHGVRGDEDTAHQWLDFAEGMAETLGQKGGLLMWAAEVHAHHGRFEQAAGVLEDPEAGFWWDPPYRAMRAETYARAGRPDTDHAIEWAESAVGEHRYAQGLLLRARGVQAGDDGPIREALELFEQIECPYQAARSGWMLGGGAHEEALRSFERLGAVAPVDPA
jgi:class 3 adenylate cyclase/tetratricopeptide (TPR) repeat protein